MAAQTRATLKGYFATGSQPTSANFGDVMDSFLLVAESSAATSAGAFGSIFLQAGTTAAGQALIATSAAGELLKSATTTAMVCSLGAEHFAVKMIQAADTTAAVTALGASTIGTRVFFAATTADAANTILKTQGSVSAGTYDNAEITVNAMGIVTNISAGGAGGSFTFATEQSTVSAGTAYDFTGIPAGIDVIVVTLDTVSLTGTDNLLVQIGDAGGIESAGYDAHSGSGGTVVSAGSGFLVRVAVASRGAKGQMVIAHVGGNKWVESHSHDIQGSGINNGGGTKTLTAELDRVRITRTGTDTFDGGSVNVGYI